MAKNKGGRPSAFNAELLEEILLAMAEGHSERQIFERAGYPEWRTWSKYKREHPEFIPHYVQAKEDGYKVWEHRMLIRAQDTSRDVIYDESEILDKDGNVKSTKKIAKSDNTAVNRDRLIIDTMKWQMSKIMSKIYGDKIEQQLTGKDGAEFQPILNITIEKKG